MNFFLDLFRKKPSVDKEKQKPVEQPQLQKTFTLQADLICPNCKLPLSKAVKAKTKCKKCGEFIYKRTHPETSEHLVVTESQAEEIDIAWAEKTKSEIFPYSGDDVKESYALKRMTPDQEWSYYNGKLQECAAKADFIVMADTYFKMAYFVYKEGRLKDTVVQFVLFIRSKNEHCRRQMTEYFTEEETIKQLKTNNPFTGGRPKDILEEAIPDQNTRAKILLLCNDIHFRNNNLDEIMKLIYDK